MKTIRKLQDTAPTSPKMEKMLKNMVAGKRRPASKGRNNKLRNALLRLKKEFYAKVPRKQRVQQLVEMVLESARLSPDKIARVLVPEDLIHDAGDKLYELQREGCIGEITWASPLAPIARKAKLMCLAILPPSWKNPAVPQRVFRFKLNEKEKAQTKAKELNRGGPYARVIRPADWAKEVSAFDPGRYRQRLEEYESGKGGGWIVQEWDPATFLRYLSTTYSQAELLDALKDLANPDNQERIERANGRLTGATKNKARGQETADEQRALFEMYKNGEVSKDKEDYSQWDKNTLIRHIAGLNRRKTGWSVRSIQKNLAGLDYPARVPRVSPGGDSGRTHNAPVYNGSNMCPPK